METITSDVLKDTGFNTWYEFYPAIYDTRPLGRLRYQHLYYKGTEERQIELPVSQIMIQALGQAELELILEKFKIKDMKALYDRVTSEGRRLDTPLTMEIVERTKENRIVLNRYSLTPRMIQSFLTPTDQSIYY